MINKLDFSSSALLPDNVADTDTEASLSGDRQLFAALLSGALPEAGQASGADRAAAQALLPGGPMHSKPMETGIEVSTAASFYQLEPGVDALELESASSIADKMMGDEPRVAQSDQFPIPEARDSDIALPGLLAELQTPQIMRLVQQVEGRTAGVQAHAATQHANISPEQAIASKDRAAVSYATSLTDSGSQQLPALSGTLLRRSDIAGSGPSVAGSTMPETAPVIEDIRNFLTGGDDTPYSRTRPQADQADFSKPSNSSSSGLVAFATASDLAEAMSGEARSGNSVDLDGELVMLRAPSSVQNSTVLPGIAHAGREYQAPIAHTSANEAPMLSSQSRSELTSSLFEISREASSTWLREIGLQGTAQVQPGGGRIVLQLHPAELGYLEIDILSQGSAASIEFISQNAGTRDLIEQSLPRLRELMQEQGLQLSGLQVRSQGRHQQDQPQHERSQAPQDLEVSQLDDSILPTATSASVRYNSSVLDLYA
jgi:hypothetical protein